MPDRFFYPLAAVTALALIALAFVWPQGIGARSPSPFGHPVAPRAPAGVKPGSGANPGGAPARVKLDAPL